jgi:hypothetical protein
MRMHSVLLASFAVALSLAPSAVQSKVSVGDTRPTPSKGRSSTDGPHLPERAPGQAGVRRVLGKR